MYASYCCGISSFPCSLFETLQHLGGQCSAFYPDKNIYGVPGFSDTKASDFIDLLKKQTFSLEYIPDIINKKITNIEQDTEFFSLNNGEYMAKYIILATGIGDMIPNIPNDISGIDNDFVHFYCIRADLYKGKDIIIAGGGDSAVDFAICMKSIAKSVTIIHRKDELRCDSHKIGKLNDINVKLSHSILSIEKNHKIITDKGTFTADYIIFCYGFRAEPGAIAGLTKLGISFEDDLISVDIDTMQTGNKKIFAIGDAITYKNKKKNLVSCFFEADKAVRMIKLLELQ
jgi:thioredoxin reductase (NADPH)